MARSRSRSPRRRRSRSRSRSRRRSRSRTRSPVGGGHAADDRHRFLVTDADAAAQSFAAQMQQQQMAALQQQQLQKQLLAQQLLMGAGGLTLPGTGGAAQPTPQQQQQQLETIHRKQREIYIGNLAIGIVTADLLREFFDQVFAHTVPDPVNNPPVANINMEPGGRFAFVEFQTDELATKALEMDKVVELCGRAMNIGRPKGYVPPAPGEKVPPAPAKSAQQQQQQQVAAPAPALTPAGPVLPPGPPPTSTLLLSNLLPAGQLRTEEERRMLQEDVQEEASKYGSVAAVCVAVPTPHVQDLMPGRCYVKYEAPEQAARARVMFDGRTLDGNVIRATFVQEEELNRAAAGEWIFKQSGVAGIPLPGLYTIAPLVSGITGLSALNPALAALVVTNPGIAAMMAAAIAEDEVPFEEGWVKLRGFTATVTKQDIMIFMQNCAPELAEDDIRLVLSADGRPLGEAFVHLHGPRAKLRLALSKDRSVMPTAHCPVEVLTAVEEDMRRRMLSGCVLA